MKVVFIPGVGYQEEDKLHRKFLSDISSEVSFEWEIFKWSHSHLIEEHDDKHNLDDSNLHYGSLRGWLAERILDFQHVLLHTKDIKIPEADIYFGHSAGSILALSAAKNKCVIFGSPLKFIEIGEVKIEEELIANFRSPNVDVLNFVHKKDVLAYPLNAPNIKNVYIDKKRFSPFGYSPMKAHEAYWKSKEVKKEIIKSINEWNL
jgi:hypothetical protein